ncbi:hypothetical protein TNCV_3094391 [Trichonephila clavipes]|nr:hypothetical protein TNCV_3094391 [Trichonephila clavipes]
MHVKDIKAQSPHTEWCGILERVIYQFICCPLLLNMIKITRPFSYSRRVDLGSGWALSRSPSTGGMETFWGDHLHETLIRRAYKKLNRFDS